VQMLPGLAACAYAEQSSVHVCNPQTRHTAGENL
jgi:hypothetical protein